MTLVALRPATPADSEFCYQAAQGSDEELRHRDLGMGRERPA
jgi:hypothetical protein